MIYPFGQFEDKGLIVIFDGNCGFTAREGKFRDKNAKSLCIYPLKEPKEPGENISHSDLDISGEFCELCFTSDKSIDVVINMLNQLKDENN